MLPAIARRCPNCGYLGWSHRFERVADQEESDARRVVECPRCGHQFAPLENPWLASLGLGT